jgi:hypothetical protein
MMTGHTQKGRERERDERLCVLCVIHGGCVCCVWRVCGVLCVYVLCVYVCLRITENERRDECDVSERCTRNHGRWADKSCIYRVYVHAARLTFQFNPPNIPSHTLSER